jgi:hypothetical protein
MEVFIRLSWLSRNIDLYLEKLLSTSQDTIRAYLKQDMSSGNMP